MHSYTTHTLHMCAYVCAVRPTWKALLIETAVLIAFNEDTFALPTATLFRVDTSTYSTAAPSPLLYSMLHVHLSCLYPLPLLSHPRKSHIVPEAG